MYPILLRIGEYELRAYGLMIALAFIVGTWLGAKEAKRKGFNPDLVYDLLLYAMVFSIIGARLYYVLFSEPSYFFSNPMEIFAVWKGGIAVHGGLLGGLVAAIFFCKMRNIPFWDFADTLTPSLMIGQAIGRGACTLNGCSFGKPTDMPWAVIFTNPDSMAPLNIPLHPTQFYELTGDLILFAVIWSLRKKMNFSGQLFLLYWCLYAILRFIVEQFRGDSLMVGDFRAAQVLSIIIFITAASIYFVRKTNQTVKL